MQEEKQIAKREMTNDEIKRTCNKPSFVALLRKHCKNYALLEPEIKRMRAE